MTHSRCQNSATSSVCNRKKVCAFRTRLRFNVNGATPHRVHLCKVILWNVLTYIRKCGFNVKVIIARLFRHFNWIVLVYKLRITCFLHRKVNFFFRIFSHFYVGSMCLNRRLHLARSCTSSPDNRTILSPTSRS